MMRMATVILGIVPICLTAYVACHILNPQVTPNNNNTRTTVSWAAEEYGRRNTPSIAFPSFPSPRTMKNGA